METLTKTGSKKMKWASEKIGENKEEKKLTTGEFVGLIFGGIALATMIWISILTFTGGLVPTEQVDEAFELGFKQGTQLCHYYTMIDVNSSTEDLNES